MPQKILRVTGAAQDKKNIFLLQKEKKGRIGECCFDHPKATTHPPQCASAISRELDMKGEEGEFSLMSISGSGLHSGLENLVIPPWLRKAGARALRNQAGQRQS